MPTTPSHPDPARDAPHQAGPHALAMIGGGRMALALADGFCRAGLATGADITVFDPDEAARARLAAAVPGIHFVATAAAAAAAAKLVFLAVKPQQAVAACQAAATGLRDEAVVVSIVAGLTTQALAGLLGTSRVIRVMPNTPCLVGRGVSAVCATPEVPDADRTRLVRLLGAVGHVHEVDESLMDAVTGLSGSGPGFVARFVEALAAGGTAAGLPAPLALALAVETVAGTGALLEATGEPPELVRERVTSPGGTTLAGLALMDTRGVPEAIAAAVMAAAARAAELGTTSTVRHTPPTAAPR
jgi:pyrroline-5-carboxylate reductase